MRIRKMETVRGALGNMVDLRRGKSIDQNVLDNIRYTIGSRIFKEVHPDTKTRNPEDAIT